nr:hypothetical protein [Pantoea cypripedii]
MRIYWTLKSIPELAKISSQQRGKRWRNAYRSTFRHWETSAGLVLLGLLAGTGSHFFGAAGAAVIAGLGGFLYSQIVIYVARKYYRHRLSGDLN